MELHCPLRRLAAACRTSRALFTVLASLAPVLPLQAAVISVGTPAGPGQCTCATIQCAFDFAAVGGPHTIRITRSSTYLAQNARLSLDQNESVDIEGGYASCGQATPDTTPTTISGAGGSDDTVLAFELASNAIVRLRRLHVRDGDDLHGNGGGISVNGGRLRIEDSIISNNAADVGGGIYNQGALLDLGPNVSIRFNSARDGAGVALRNAGLTMNEAGSLIFSNTASGYGGGLWVGPGSAAQIGIAGLPGFGALYANRAAYGGGAAAIASRSVGGFASLDFSSVDPAAPTGVVGNLATVRGGGLYARAGCCYSAGSGEGAVPARLALSGNAYLRDNAAPDGAAVHLERDPDEDVAGQLTMRGGSITLNQTRTADNTPTDGAVLHLADDPGLLRGLNLSQVVLQNNEGGHLIRNDGKVRIDDSLLVDNIARSSLIRGVGSDGYTHLFGSTIAGNAIGAAAVIEASNDFLLKTSILHQPGKTSLLRTGGVRTVENVVASEIASLSSLPGGDIVRADPRFWDPESANYRLHPASIAIDSTTAGVEFDIEGNPRSVDLERVGNRGGPRDLGPYERQALLPLVRNHTFSTLRLWQANGGVLVADSAQSDGSGSVYVAATAPAGGRVIGPTQCVPLPARGNYALRGWGKEPSATMASADIPRLEWQLYTNSADCNGTASATGGINLPSGNDWALSGSTQFSVPNDGSLRPIASVLILLVAVDGNVSGANLVDAYFDSILLEPIGDGNLAPAITTQLPNRTHAEGDSVSIETAPHFHDPDNDALTFSATGLPDGVAIDPGGGAIVGTLSMLSAGPHSVLVRATDPFGASVAQAFGWTITNVNRMPTTTGLPDRTDAEGVSISVDIRPAFDDPDTDDVLVFSSADPLPPGLALQADGRFIGVLDYAAAGTYPITVTADDGEGGSVQAGFDWTVTDTPQGNGVFRDGFEDPQ